MYTHTEVPLVRRFRGAAIVTIAALAVSACFLPNPPVDEDPSAGESSSSGGPGSSGAPTTSGAASSSGEATTTTTDAEGSSTSSTGSSTSTGEDEASSSGTTEFSLPTCPYEPSGGNVMVRTTDDGQVTELTTQACGTMMTFDRVRMESSAGMLQMAKCSDNNCEDCDPGQMVEVSMGLPDPFDSLGPVVIEGNCVELGVVWERPVDDACTPSRVVLRKVDDGVPSVVPGALYRLASGLDVTDEIDGFALTAAEGSMGPVHCPCEGDCCRDEPGSRFLDFTVDVGGELFMAQPLEAEQAQTVPLGVVEDKPNAAVISLVRAHYPSDCAALPTFEWVFRHPVFDP